MRALEIAGLLGLLTAVQPADGSGVKVSFIDPGSYTDFGHHSSVASDPERQLVANALAANFRELGARYLRPDDLLHVEILDVDLAGALQFEPQSGRQVRVLRPADPPRLRVRWQMLGDGIETRGEDSVTDLGYQHELGACRFDKPLCHEARMLNAWFSQRFGGRLKR